MGEGGEEGENKFSKKDAKLCGPSHLESTLGLPDTTGGGSDAVKEKDKGDRAVKKGPNLFMYRFFRGGGQDAEHQRTGVGGSTQKSNQVRKGSDAPVREKGSAVGKKPGCWSISS